MSLGSDQREFTRMLQLLLEFLHDNGYEATLGDAYRDKRVHGDYGVRVGYGHSRSFHKKRLAIDLNLFKDGKYLTDTEDHRPLGMFWKSIGGTWGGDFKKKDGNHYSYGESR